MADQNTIKTKLYWDKQQTERQTPSLKAITPPVMLVINPVRDVYNKCNCSKKSMQTQLTGVRFQLLQAKHITDVQLQRRTEERIKTTELHRQGTGQFTGHHGAAALSQNKTIILQPVRWTTSLSSLNGVKAAIAPAEPSVSTLLKTSHDKLCCI